MKTVTTPPHLFDTHSDWSGATAAEVLVFIHANPLSIQGLLPCTARYPQSPESLQCVTHLFLCVSINDPFVSVGHVFIKSQRSHATAASFLHSIWICLIQSSAYHSKVNTVNACPTHSHWSGATINKEYCTLIENQEPLHSAVWSTYGTGHFFSLRLYFHNDESCKSKMCSLIRTLNILSQWQKL